MFEIEEPQHLVDKVYEQKFLISGFGCQSSISVEYSLTFLTFERNERLNNLILQSLLEFRDNLQPE